jgi:hypothetical protein
MGNAFTQVDWDLIRTRAGTVAAQLRAKGAEVWDFEPLPPVPRAQLEEFTRKTRIVFPSDFVDLVTNFAGGWNFSWCLCETKTGKWLKSPVFMGNFGGNAEVPFIGASTDETLLDRYESFQDEIRNSIHNRNSCLEDSEMLRLLSALFPLHTCDGSGGDTPCSGSTWLRPRCTTLIMNWLGHWTTNIRSASDSVNLYSAGLTSAFRSASIIVAG